MNPLRLRKQSSDSGDRLRVRTGKLLHDEQCTAAPVPQYQAQPSRVQSKFVVGRPRLDSPSGPESPATVRFASM